MTAAISAICSAASARARPSTPDVGETIDLGTGRFRLGKAEKTLTFGLEPADGRQTDWFDPAKLYRLHDQTVELEFTAA